MKCDDAADMTVSRSYPRAGQQVRFASPSPIRVAYSAVSSVERTPRQRIMDLLDGTRLTSHQLAQMLGLPERHIEDHLVHVKKTLARDTDRRFVLEPSTCPDCGFIFRDRTRLTKPSRCPHCRGEAVTAPRYGIDATGS